MVITVYVFPYSGLKAKIAFLLEISSLFDAFMQPKMNTTITPWQKDMNYINSSFMFEWQNHLLSSPVMTITTSLAGPGPIMVEADTVML